MWWNIDLMEILAEWTREKDEASGLPSGFRSNNFVASINHLTGSPKMVRNVTEFRNRMMCRSTHFLLVYVLSFSFLFFLNYYFSAYQPLFRVAVLYFCWCCWSIQWDVTSPPVIKCTKIKRKWWEIQLQPSSSTNYNQKMVMSYAQDKYFFFWRRK